MNLYTYVVSAIANLCSSSRVNKNFHSPSQSSGSLNSGSWPEQPEFSGQHQSGWALLSSRQSIFSRTKEEANVMFTGYINIKNTRMYPAALTFVPVTNFEDNKATISHQTHLCLYFRQLRAKSLPAAVKALF